MHSEIVEEDSCSLDDCVFVKWKDDDEEVVPVVATTNPSIAVIESSTQTSGVEELKEFRTVNPGVTVKVSLYSFVCLMILKFPSLPFASFFHKFQEPPLRQISVAKEK